jgi:hypothetical protein
MVARNITSLEADKLYKSLTEELKGTILDAGGPQALSAFERANATFASISERRKALAKIVGMKGDAAPEAVFARLQAMAGSKSSADIQRLVKARKAMGPQAWNEVASAIIAKMGRDPQDNFSPDRFFTAYGGLSTNAKELLFRSTGKPELAKALDNLNTVVNGIRERITKFANPSGTAQNVAGIGIITSAIHNPLQTLGSILGGTALAEALTRPASVKAITEWARTAEMVTRSPSRTNSLLFQTATRNLANVIGGGEDFAVQLQSIMQGRPEDNPVSALRM